ncbi:hypothetical protein [Ensifer aridi]|uniref:hypothetical protein n=1 Tax=Ensifer aridi TaxID=1708715 RepID=UPI0015E2C4C5|nr:hypothetical protein [Ensifer aridi]
MKSDMAAYRVTELTPEEAAETSGGFWQIAFAVCGFLGFVAATIGGWVLDRYVFKT